MKKAVIVTVYNYPEYLNFFVDQLLCDGTTDVFLHIDKSKEEIKGKIQSRERVYYIKNNVSVSWGGYSFLQAIVNSWKEVLEKDHYDWIILCSGQDIMLRNDLDAFLEKHPGEIFLDSHKDDKMRRVFLLNRWPSWYFVSIDNKYNPIRVARRLRIELIKLGIPFFRRNLSWNTKEMIFYKNYWWSVIPEEVVRWIVEYINLNPDYYDVFKGLIAEEGFIGTTIMQSPYRNRLVFDEKGYSHSLTFINYTVNSHPPVLTFDDIGKIEKTNLFFARKIKPGNSDELIEYVRKRFYK